MEHTYLKNDPILCTFVIFRRLLMFKKAQKTTRRCIVQSDDAHMFPWVLKKSLSFNPNQTRPSFNPGVEAFDQRLALFAHHITTFYSRSIRRETSRLHPFFFFLPPSPDSNDNVRIFSAPPRQCQTRLLRTNRS